MSRKGEKRAPRPLARRPPFHSPYTCPRGGLVVGGETEKKKKGKRKPAMTCCLFSSLIFRSGREEKKGKKPKKREKKRGPLFHAFSISNIADTEDDKETSKEKKKKNVQRGGGGGGGRENSQQVNDPSYVLVQRVGRKAKGEEGISLSPRLFKSPQRPGKKIYKKRKKRKKSVTWICDVSTDGGKESRKGGSGP